MILNENNRLGWRRWWLALVLCFITACSGSEDPAMSLTKAQGHTSQLSEALAGSETETSVGGKKTLKFGQSYQVSKNVTLYVQDGRILSFQASKEVGEQEYSKWSSVLGSRYVVGDLHATDVTPVLWRTLDVKLAKGDGSFAHIQMLRPLWWLENTGARAGGFVNLSLTEAGLFGEARILSIKDDVRQDSRKLKSGTALVIGKIRHENARVLEMVIDGDQEHPLGVTPNHPLFSVDSQAFLPAGKFKVRDRIRTAQGSVAMVTAVRMGASSVPVYNLEVHRAQSYYVGKQKLLAHNTGIICGFSDDAVDSAFPTLQTRGGHIMRHLEDVGIIPNRGSPESKYDVFKALAKPILTNPSHTAPWRIGNIQGRAFLGSHNDKTIAIIVATEGHKQGIIVGAIVPDANQLSIMMSR